MQASQTTHKNNTSQNTKNVWIAIGSVVLVFVIAFLWIWVYSLITKERMPKEELRFVTSIESELQEYYAKNGSFPEEITDLSISEVSKDKFEIIQGGDYYFTYKTYTRADVRCIYEITYENIYNDSFGLVTGNILYQSKENKCSK